MTWPGKRSWKNVLRPHDLMDYNPYRHFVITILQVIYIRNSSK